MFRTEKSIMFLLTAVMAVSAAAFISVPKAKAANSISIVIDGIFFQPPDAQPYISNDRVMVPFRPIAEAMGATANWDQAAQAVSVSLGSKNVQFIIGSSSMDVVTTDPSGGIIRTTVTLDAPATLVNGNRAFVPIRALTEGLGATVQWVAESSSVIITSNVVRATPTPAFTPTPAVNPVFATTNAFEIVSGTRAQTMYDNYNHEVLLFFNSTDPNAVSAMPGILQAAASVPINQTVKGVDVSTSPNLSNLNWVYNYVNRGSNGPVLFFIYNINQQTKVLSLASFTDQNVLNTMFSNWYRNIYTNTMLTPTVTPTPTYYLTPTPTILPGNFKDPFSLTSKADAIDMYNRGDEFVLLYFDSSRSDYSQSKMNVAMQAVYDADEPVYYFDDSKQGDYSWFGGDFYSGSYSYFDSTNYSKNIPNPCMFFVDNGMVDYTEDTFRSSYNLTDRILNYLGY